MKAYKKHVKQHHQDEEVKPRSYIDLASPIPRPRQRSNSSDDLRDVSKLNFQDLISQQQKCTALNINAE